MTHPFHPLRGERLLLLYQGSAVGTEWLLLQRDDGTPLRIPREWTDLRACDPYQDLSSGQGLFRLPDLLSLASLLKVSDQEGARPEGEDVQ